jgi:hypothetical protein
VFEKDGRRRLGGSVAAGCSVADLGESVLVATEEGFADSIDVGVLGAGCKVLFLDGEGIGDMSIDGGRPLLLPLLHVDLPG